MQEIKALKTQILKLDKSNPKSGGSNPKTRDLQILKL